VRFAGGKKRLTGEWPRVRPTDHDAVSTKCLDFLAINFAEASVLSAKNRSVGGDWLPWPSAARADVLQSCASCLWQTAPALRTALGRPTVVCKPPGSRT